ncbi:DUF2059 domain-containing protein [Thalassotalea mangrovi]|uniref:DUF2059 domain-containing protein n=1 Tax=Thalassotalea mangrovi TaxID=2572245 RepID=A0A4U1B7D2_9GAMM|nr:DUF2059 domain-containing protein [Thalassotalea mangrovi]TKB45850.1 DUF2059 domain-containing protein [Thalassotalea mangrovi]
MKQRVIFLLLAVLLSKTSLAEAHSERLIDLLDIESTWNEYLSLVTVNNKPLQSHSEKLDYPDELDYLEVKHYENLEAINKKYLNWEDIRTYLAISYEQLYSPDELEALIVFFESPVGRKWLSSKNQNHDLIKEEINERFSEYSDAVRKESSRYKTELEKFADETINE